MSGGVLSPRSLVLEPHDGRLTDFIDPLQRAREERPSLRILTVATTSQDYESSRMQSKLTSVRFVTAVRLTRADIIHASRTIIERFRARRIPHVDIKHCRPGNRVNPHYTALAENGCNKSNE